MSLSKSIPVKQEQKQQANKIVEFFTRSAQKQCIKFIKDMISIKKRAKEHMDKIDRSERKNINDVKELKDIKGNEDVRELKDVKELKDIKRNQDVKELKESKDVKELKDIKRNQDVKELKESKDVKELDIKGNQDVKELKEIKELKDVKGNQDIKELKDTKDNKDTKILDLEKQIEQKQSNEVKEPNLESGCLVEQEKGSESKTNTFGPESNAASTPQDHLLSMETLDSKQNSSKALTSLRGSIDVSEENSIVSPEENADNYMDTNHDYNGDYSDHTSESSEDTTISDIDYDTADEYGEYSCVDKVNLPFVGTMKNPNKVKFEIIEMHIHSNYYKRGQFGFKKEDIKFLYNFKAEMCWGRWRKSFYSKRCSSVNEAYYIFLAKFNGCYTCCKCRDVFSPVEFYNPFYSDEDYNPCYSSVNNLDVGKSIGDGDNSVKDNVKDSSRNVKDSDTRNVKNSDTRNVKDNGGTDGGVNDMPNRYICQKCSFYIDAFTYDPSDQSSNGVTNPELCSIAPLDPQSIGSVNEETLNNCIRELLDLETRDELEDEKMMDSKQDETEMKSVNEQNPCISSPQTISTNTSEVVSSINTSQSISINTSEAISNTNASISVDSKDEKINKDCDDKDIKDCRDNDSRDIKECKDIKDSENKDVKDSEKSENKDGKDNNGNLINKENDTKINKNDINTNTISIPIAYRKVKGKNYSLLNECYVCSENNISFSKRADLKCPGASKHTGFLCSSCFRKNREICPQCKK